MSRSWGGSSRAPIGAITIIACTAWPTPGVAQSCEGRWVPMESGTPSVVGVSGNLVAAEAWDPDGPGPLGTHLVVGGVIAAAGSAIVRNIAMYDPATSQWSPLGSGLDGEVRALAVLPGGTLVAAGSFTSAGGVPVNRVAMWNGSAWTPLGSGLGDPLSTAETVNTLLASSDGQLFAAGRFASAGAAPVNNIARWDGAEWLPLAEGVSGTVQALSQLPSGHIVAGGSFTAAGAASASRVALWDGSTWSPLGAGVNDTVNALRVLPSGELVAGGRFTTAGGAAAQKIARWNGAAWQALGSGLAWSFGGSSEVRALALNSNGDLFVGGSFNRAGGTPAFSVAVWNASGWTAAGLGTNNPVYGLAVLPGDAVYAAGGMTSTPAANATSGVVNSVARFDGTRWAPLNEGTSGSVRDLATLTSGDVVAVGTFTHLGGAPAKGVARWNGTAWMPVGSGAGNAAQPGVFATNEPPICVAALANDEFVVGGAFSSMGGVAARAVAKWNGSAWSNLGAGLDVITDSLAPGPGTGEILAAGTGLESSVFRWNGATWSQVGTSLRSPGFVRATAVAMIPGGNVVVGGAYGQGASVMRWTGAAWSPLGGGLPMSSIQDMDILSNGDLIAAGSINAAAAPPSSNIARWDGSSWRPLDSGTNQEISAVAIHPSGDVIVVGGFSSAGGIPTPGIARWNGTAWQPFAAGFTTIRSGSSELTIPSALAARPNGDIIVGGYFSVAGGVLAPAVARYTTTPACYANCDCSSSPPTLNALDFNCFLQRYRQDLTLPPPQQPAAYANCDGSTAAPVLNALDFQCFLTRYNAGCR